MTDTNGGAEAGMQIDADLVRQLARLLNENDLSEIEVEDGDRRIKVKRQIAGIVAASPAAAPAPSAPPAIAVADEVSDSNHPGVVKSPMVGTVFLAGEPGAAPFVSTGAKVGVGDTLLIVEAMKVMNPIVSTRAGTVRRILVEDAQPVEYDQPLVIVE